MRCLTIILALWAVAASVGAKEPDYVLVKAGEVPAGVEVRGDAKLFLLINARALLDGDKVNEKAEIWDALRKDLKAHDLTTLHARVYLDGPVQPPSGIPKAIKTQLAELELFVGWIDWEYRNDMLPWEKRLVAFKRQ